MVRFVGREGSPPLGAIFLGIGVVATVAVGLLHLDRLPFSLCVFKTITGIPCMTCGTTRTLGLLARGHFRDALFMNPLAAVLGAAIAFWGICDLVLLRRKAALGLELAPLAGTALKVAGVVVVLANWAYLIAAGR